MALVIVALIVIAVVWWLKRERALTRNERLYLRRRGYDPGESEPAGPPLDRDAQLLDLIQSLTDISPYARQRAAEQLSRMCVGGRKDPRMFTPLVAALDDSEAAVRSAAAMALASFDDPRAVDSLRRRLEVDESILFRTTAKKAIEKLTS
jgi:HEAT repeat protein